MARWNRLLPHWFTASVLVFVALVCTPGNVNSQHLSHSEAPGVVSAPIVSGLDRESSADEPYAVAGTSVGTAPAESSTPQVLELRESHDEPTVDQLFEEIRSLLGAIPTGKEALGIMKMYHVTVKSEAGAGSRFNQSSNTVVIDSAHDLVPAALLFVHEMNHVQYYHEGMAADAKALSREEYVLRKVEEEVDGDAKSIHARMELREAGVDVRQVYYPFAVEYEMYYNRAVESAKAETPAKSDQALESIGQEAGKGRILWAFERGWMLTSTTNETYLEFYGRWWDADNNS